MTLATEQPGRQEEAAALNNQVLPEEILVDRGWAALPAA